jgi:hypothetical protein
MNRAVVIGLVLMGSSPVGRAAAQSREVMGTVREAWTGRPIANAEVSVIGDEGWVCTNDRGEYRLPARTGIVSVIARYGESIGRPRTLATTDTVAALDIDPRLMLTVPSEPKQVGEFYAIGAYVFANLVAAPEIEIARGRYYVGGVELVVRPSRCGPSVPARRGAGES